jgi:threonylcarbamoyladenosine tRNA methylthiotransferase MtaB
LIKVAISTLGCKVNQYESAGILEKLDKSLFLPVPFHTKADCYIINTCTVTGRTDYQSRQIIRRAIRMNPDACIVVTGCYAQVAPGDIARIPGVSLIAGTVEKENIPQIIQHLVKGGPQFLVTDIGDASEFSRLSPSHFPGHTRAFLKIQDGCNSFCSYCIVPYARGQSRSLAEREVFHKIKTLTGNGYREIVLTGIHLGVYGEDLVPPSNLVTIMNYVEKNKSVQRLRLSSIEITEITDDMIRLMKKSATLCRHLHIPLQSGDDGILAAMKRNYDSAFFKKRLEEIHRELPRIAVGIDVMVGFPGEGEEAFHNTVALLEELPLAYVHVFPYSERPGTQAKELSGKVSDAVKKRRNEIVRNLGSIKRKTFAEKFIGEQLAVLVEDKQDKETGSMKGFSDNYIPVVIRNGDSSLVNHIVNVRADDSHDGKLYGRIIDND